MERRVFTFSAATLSGSTNKLDPIGLARRLIVKIGSALIGDPESGEIRGSWLETLIEDVVRFFARGQQVIIVTSGSTHLNHLDRSLRVEEKQTVAAIVQVQLMRAYEQSLDAIVWRLENIIDPRRYR
ncbi:hypothetical protein NKH75_28405 [Mesorhizobium sp. M0984]|uniref:amino acid kinase family protein n=1 Tax=unclassified Mesorhizobium TaxID=325217 RepID=UPI00333B969E